jgi:hypothetical protein
MWGFLILDQLGALMEARGIPAEPEEIRALAERSGLDGEEVLGATTRDIAEEMGGAEARGLLGGLAGELGLSKRETLALAAAFVFEDDDAEARG